MQRAVVLCLGLAMSAALLLFPAHAHAQGAITGVVRDASGGVLPGVTVEVASPVLIEKLGEVCVSEGLATLVTRILARDVMAPTPVQS